MDKSNTFKMLMQNKIVFQHVMHFHDFVQCRLSRLVPTLYRTRASFFRCRFLLNFNENDERKKMMFVLLFVATIGLLSRSKHLHITLELDGRNWMAAIGSVIVLTPTATFRIKFNWNEMKYILLLPATEWKGYFRLDFSFSALTSFRVEISPITGTAPERRDVWHKKKLSFSHKMPNLISTWINLMAFCLTTRQTTPRPNSNSIFPLTDSTKKIITGTGKMPGKKY